MLLEAETNKYCPGGYDIGAISNLITWVLNFFWVHHHYIKARCRRPWVDRALQKNTHTPDNHTKKLPEASFSLKKIVFKLCCPAHLFPNTPRRFVSACPPQNGAAKLQQMRGGERTSRATVLRIRDVYPGSRIPIFIHSGSQIQKQQQKRGVKKKFVVKPFFVATNFTKL